MDTRSWYEALAKPSWAPEVAVFGRVWTAIYPIIFAVNIYVLARFLGGKLPLAAALPFWLNLAANFAFTPVQFGLRNQLLSLLVIVLVEVTIIWSMVAIWPYHKWVALAYVPYLVWVSIATALQYQIWRLN